MHCMGIGFLSQKNIFRYLYICLDCKFVYFVEVSVFVLFCFLFVCWVGVGVLVCGCVYLFVWGVFVCLFICLFDLFCFVLI